MNERAGPRWVDAATVARTLDYPSLVATLARALALPSRAPSRHRHALSKGGDAEHQLLLMPAWEEGGFGGVKIVNFVPGNTKLGAPSIAASYLLFDACTGAHLAIFEGNALTARRTAGVAALSASLLSRRDSRRLLVVGSGHVASELPGAFRSIRPIDKIEVWSRSKESAQTLVDKLASQGIAANVSDDLETSVTLADIVSSATAATAPLIRGSWVRPGTHLDLIGGFTPAMREVDDNAIARSTVFVDTLAAITDAGDLVHPIASGVVQLNHMRGNLRALLSDEKLGRSADDEITVFKAIGTANADLAAARLVHSRLATAQCLRISATLSA